MSTNKISIEISTEKDTAVNQIVDNLAVELDFLVDLSVADRRSLPKMGRRNVDLVERAFQHAEGNPELKPGYYTLEEFKKDVDLAKWLRKLEKRIALLNDKIVDTAMLAESEAFAAARLFYSSVKDAAGAGDEKAELITKDLAVHFKRLGPKGDTDLEKKKANAAANAQVSQNSQPND